MPKSEFSFARHSLPTCAIAIVMSVVIWATNVSDNTRPTQAAQKHCQLHCQRPCKIRTSKANGTHPGSSSVREESDVASLIGAPLLCLCVAPCMLIQINIQHALGNEL